MSDMHIMKRLHIVGCPRSGTTLMLELISTCFKRDGVCDHEMSIYKEPEGSPALFFGKQPSDIKRIEPILRIDPNLFVICMVRDPRSVITSIHSSKIDIYFCNFRAWKEYNDAGRRLLGHPRFLQIRYEDLVQKSSVIQQQIMDRFPFLEKTHDFSEYENFANPSRESTTAMGGLRGITADRVRGWEKHLPRIKSELAKHPGMINDLIEYGYEKDDAWVSIIDNINPVEYKCRYPDRKPRLKTLESKFRNWRKFKRYVSRHNFKH